VDIHEDAEMTAFNEIMLILSEAIIISLGSLIAYVSARAYHRNKSTSMLFMSLGFAVIVIGSLMEELMLELLRFPMIEAHMLENLILAAGLLLIVYSIYGTRG
jgi:predicted Abi (CAAX) family protease